MSVTHGRSIFDLVWPASSREFTEVAADFCANVITSALASTWAGYDSLRGQVIDQIDISAADEELERALTQLLEPKIAQHLTGDEPYILQHGPYEFETRKQAPAQPPQYDLAFVLLSNSRVMWPLEAKVLRTDAAVSRYVKSVENEFLTGRYAPFVNSAAMLGYLLKGNTSTALESIANSLHTVLVQHEDFQNRPHRVSTHQRAPSYPQVTKGSFQCHHLILAMR